ncbi:hypothetical protein ACJX0J_017760, partial [Zea mays]
SSDKCAKELVQVHIQSVHASCGTSEQLLSNHSGIFGLVTTKAIHPSSYLGSFNLNYFLNKYNRYFAFNFNFLHLSWQHNYLFFGDNVDEVIILQTPSEGKFIGTTSLHGLQIT